MSNRVVRRNSSKQGLQDLMRLMAQRSIEDAEELERERRQRAREASRMVGCSTEFPAENETQAGENRFDWKPYNSPALEDDEGFGDWSHQMRQQLQERHQGGGDIGEKVISRSSGSLLASSTSNHLQHLQQREDSWSQGETIEAEEALTLRMEEGQSSDPEKRKEAKVSSKVFLHQEEIQQRDNMKTAKATSLTKMPTRSLLPKIDDKMEQSTHAVENSQVRSVKTSLRDLRNLKDLRDPRDPRDLKDLRDLSSSEVVASRKSLFEVGDTWNHNCSKAVPWKDTDGLKVGVAELISQWVKGQSEDSSRSSCTVLDVKPGDVMQKKNLWEEIRDSSNQRSQASTASKKYKFVVTGHSKYQRREEDLTQSD